MSFNKGFVKHFTRIVYKMNLDKGRFSSLDKKVHSVSPVPGFDPAHFPFVLITTGRSL